jgi:peptide deformylase
MTIHPILTEPNPILRQISKAVAKVTDDTRNLMEDMLETMYNANGIGLAAIQIGIAQRILVIDISEKEDTQEKNPLYFINPEIISSSEETQSYKEGCLSVPEIYENVTRPETITVTYLDYHGTPQTLEASGLLSVCLQHEMDHLNGVLFIDKISKLKRQLALSKIRKKNKIKLA